MKSVLKNCYFVMRVFTTQCLQKGEIKISRICQESKIKFMNGRNPGVSFTCRDFNTKENDVERRFTFR